MRPGFTAAVRAEVAKIVEKIPNNDLAIQFDGSWEITDIYGGLPGLPIEGAIERNVAHDNGKHGIILAEECSDGVVRDNVAYNNLHHGIVIYQRSNNTVVEGNTVLPAEASALARADAIEAPVAVTTTPSIVSQETPMSHRSSQHDGGRHD